MLQPALLLLPPTGYSTLWPHWSGIPRNKGPNWSMLSQFSTVIILHMILEKLFGFVCPSETMTHNVRCTVPGHTYPQRKSIWLLFPPPQALSPLCSIPYKMIKWSPGTHLSFVVLRLLASVHCVGFCVCVSNPEVRGIICCNCSPSGALITDRYPKYGSWIVQYQYFHRWTDNWVIAVISSLLSLQLASM